MENGNNGKATASLVLGIISLVFIFFGTYAFLGIILAIIGLVLGIQAKKEDPNDSKARAGVVLSIVGLALCAVTFVACFACIGLFASLA
ncbi:MAG: hypothetical protein E7255_11950 [Lachnospiraceae bacterium]|jgi:uncharacterized membrane protein|nr:hypothetical protein [Lachnospiraceae bacterium]